MVPTRLQDDGKTLIIWYDDRPYVLTGEARRRWLDANR